MSAARVTFPFRGFRERPYSQSGLDITLWRQIPPTLVDYGDLWLTQTKLNVGWFFGERLSRPGHPVSVDVYPFVVVFDGERYLEDGHHRVVLDAYQGATKRLMREFAPVGVVSGQSHALRAGRTTSPADRTAGSGAHVAVASAAAAGGGRSADCEDSPLPPGLQPDDTVWMAVERRGTPYHNPMDPDGAWPHRRTACERSMRTGVELQARIALALYDALPCRLCWPPFAPDSAWPPYGHEWEPVPR